MRVVPRSVVLGLGSALLVPTAARAAENDPPTKCFDLNGEGELPTCTYDGSSWEVTYPGSGGVPAWVVWVSILAVLAALAVLVWRVSVSRRARQAKLDEGTTPQARGSC